MPRRSPEPRPRSADRHAYQAVLVRPERDGQADEWREAAARAGMTLAAWVRQACDEAARRD